MLSIDMPVFIKKVLLCFLITALSACASQVNKTNKQTDANKNATAKLNPPKAIDAIEYLEFAETYSNLTADIQKQTLSATNQALALNANDIASRMQLVMIYGLPSSSLMDTAKAQNLLQQILQEDILANSQLAYAHVLFDYLVMTNKMIKHNADEPKRNDNSQQKNEVLQQKLDAALQKLDATQLKLDAAQQKLDELKKIEKSMSDRGTKPK